MQTFEQRLKTLNLSSEREADRAARAAVTVYDTLETAKVIAAELLPQGGAGAVLQVFEALRAEQARLRPDGSYARSNVLSDGGLAPPHPRYSPLPSHPHDVLVRPCARCHNHPWPWPSRRRTPTP